MKLTGNTILITGGGSGIGLGFAEALHRRGNKVIIAGRRRGVLDAALAANPGMEAVELDISDPAAIERVTADVVKRFPDLNVLMNNAGIMHGDNVGGRTEDWIFTSIIGTNLLGPLRMSSALLEHLKTRPDATIIYTTSVLGFVPIAPAATYSAAKAALHAYILAQRYKLQGSGVSVLELVPPRVQVDPKAPGVPGQIMALNDFVSECLEIMASGAPEIVVKDAQKMRANPGPDEHDFVNKLNLIMQNVALEP